MYLRLAFAVAAHLEPEILIVDEVLAVGDAAFQKKCLGKMGDVARQGRTVLFVSHNMDAIQRLCTRCVLLEHGRIAAEGPTARVVAQYLSRDLGEGGPETWVDVTSAPRTGNGDVRFVAAWYSGRNAEAANAPLPGGPLSVRLTMESRAPRSVESLAMSVRTHSGTLLVNADALSLGRPVSLRAGLNTVAFDLDELYLNPGRYVVDLWASDAHGTTFDYVESAFEIEVAMRQNQSMGMTPHENGAVPCQFEVRAVDRSDRRHSAGETVSL